jgi:methylated-DNA-[protein]-cysteine S-methyltransferase
MLENIVFIRHYQSPAGELILGSFNGGLCLCDWVIGKHHDRTIRRIGRAFNAKIVEGESSVIDDTIKELEEYFSQKRTMFDVPLLFAGTDFQKRVWSKLIDIPYGTTLSYGEMSCSLGCPKAVRAVANANGANAISVIVPCHRVIGSNGQLGGYGGGLETKRALLNLESNNIKVDYK